MRFINKGANYNPCEEKRHIEDIYRVTPKQVYSSFLDLILEKTVCSCCNTKVPSGANTTWYPDVYKTFCQKRPQTTLSSSQLLPGGLN